MQYFESAVVALVLLLNASSGAENCDKYGVLFYEDIACKPVKANDDGQCPNEYDCDLSQPKSGCTFKGKIYGSEDEISSDLTYAACGIGCRCKDSNYIECVQPDCSEYFSESAEPDCYIGYELGKCCATEQICNSTETMRCEVDGHSYEIGQQFYPKSTCFICVCHENFTGEYDQHTCLTQNCAAQIQYGSEIAQKCAPAYFTYHSDEVLCCPDMFVCPDREDSIKIVNLETEQDPDLECSYGEKKLKLGEGLERKVNKLGKDRNLQCECILPPLLTCIELT